MAQDAAIAGIHSRLLKCTACPRLRKHCLAIAEEKKKSFRQETYWGKPVPGFGDPQAEFLIVGLAPAAHGANRTGRIFTGDRSGDWLFRALHKAGFANQAASTHVEDGLQLFNTYVTCAVHCAPPDNKPEPAEFQRCSVFLQEEVKALRSVRVVLVLGQLAMNALWPLLSTQGLRKPDFKHGGEAEVAGNRKLLMSYHPSQQNTFTGRLTEPMFDQVFSRAATLLSKKD
jgi:uracil-DNA glycosylase